MIFVPSLFVAISKIIPVDIRFVKNAYKLTTGTRGTNRVRAKCTMKEHTKPINVDISLSTIAIF